VRRAAEQDPDFLPNQPSLVLRLGAELPRERTVMFNVHLDTVAGIEPVAFDGRTFTGRGSIDAKGPAVSLLAGLRAAIDAEPALGRDIGVLVQAVAGEEGGAMGTFGTRPLVEDGWVGRLNVFCEPTGMRYSTCSTASATARITVTGCDAVDDNPDAGHNATVLLGFLAQQLAVELDPRGRAGRLCVGGVRTGSLHNRVYGSGELLVNLSYASSEEGTAAARELADTVRKGLAEFTAAFSGTREFARTAADAASITDISWVKRDLPSLDGRDADIEAVFERAGIARRSTEEPAFTCDAIWMDGVPDVGTAVLGPGLLEANNAHAAGEHAQLDQLREFARAVPAVLSAFAQHRRA
jgi:acetylornithine deacetylase/succinyl-diaminopimelate desuccinylase-like protein